MKKKWHIFSVHVVRGVMMVGKVAVYPGNVEEYVKRASVDTSVNEPGFKIVVYQNSDSIHIHTFFKA